jgi:hypothetical protein
MDELDFRDDLDVEKLSAMGSSKNADQNRLAAVRNLEEFLGSYCSYGRNVDPSLRSNYKKAIKRKGIPELPLPKEATGSEV